MSTFLRKCEIINVVALLRTEAGTGETGAAMLPFNKHQQWCQDVHLSSHICLHRRTFVSEGELLSVV